MVALDDAILRTSFVITFHQFINKTIVSKKYLLCDSSCALVIVVVFVCLAPCILNRQRRVS